MKNLNEEQLIKYWASMLNESSYDQYSSDILQEAMDEESSLQNQKYGWPIKIHVHGVTKKRENVDKVLQDPNQNKVVKLEAEPDNEFDEYAIKVIVDGLHVGYIPANASLNVSEDHLPYNRKMWEYLQLDQLNVSYDRGGVYRGNPYIVINVTVKENNTDGASSTDEQPSPSDSVEVQPAEQRELNTDSVEKTTDEKLQELKLHVDDIPALTSLIEKFTDSDWTYINERPVIWIGLISLIPSTKGVFRQKILEFKPWENWSQRDWLTCFHS